MSKLKNKIAAYEVQDYDARDILTRLDEEMNFNEVYNLVSKLEFEVDLKEYPALYSFLCNAKNMEQELKAIKEYVFK